MGRSDLMVSASDLMVSAGDTLGSDGSATAGDRLHGDSSDAGGRRLECGASTDVVVGSGSTGFHGGRLARAKGKQAQLRVRGDLKGDWVSRRRASDGYGGGGGGGGLNSN